MQSHLLVVSIFFKSVYGRSWKMPQPIARKTDLMVCTEALLLAVL